MALEITQQQAISNLENLAKLVCNGDNRGNVYLGLMKTTDGRTRVVKFNAGKKMTPEMKESWRELHEQIDTWAEASNDAKWKTFARTLVHSEHFGERRKDSAVVFVKNALDIAFQGEDFKAKEFENGRPLSFKEVKNALATDERFTYRPQKASERGAAIGKTVGLRSKFMNAVHAFGRGFMRMSHAINAFFHGRIGTEEWKKTVDDYKGLVGVGGSVQKLIPPELKDANPVKFDAHVVASSCGLSGDLAIRPFGKDEKLYPNGNPSISDIKQNPELQDCWFLSSLAATLRSRGPEYIKGLIDTENAPPGSALVRLGQHKYNVPLGDVMVDGKRAVSDSAPWVRILEQAMAMHVSQQEKDLHPDENREVREADVKMSFRGSYEALDALSGLERSRKYDAKFDFYYTTEFVSGRNAGDLTIGELADKFDHGKRPLVLGSRSGVSGAFVSLGTGVSPGHACAVLDVDEGANRVTVLDPYGHVRHVSAGDLKYFDMVFLDEGNLPKSREGAVKEVKAAKEEVKPEIDVSIEEKKAEVLSDWEDV